MKKLINFIQFQAVWFVCILGAAYQWELPAMMISLAIIAWAFLISENRSHDQFISMLALGIGFLVDTALIQFNVMTFQSSLWQEVSPLWMSLIWVALALTIQSSMSWLKDRLFLAAFLGAISGPFAYWAGVRMGAGEFTEIKTALITLAVIWFILTPLLFYCSNRWRVSHESN